MKSRSFDPLHLPVEAFAQAAGELEGSWPIADLPRLTDAAHAEAKPDAGDAVAWHLRGESRAMRSGASQTWLHVDARCALSLVCQRCLGPVAAEVHARRSFLFAADEAAATALDAEVEDDVLVLTRSLDARELVEDELLLALPLVPRHEVCPDPLPLPADDVPAGDERPNPFAVLSALKNGRSGT